MNEFELIERFFRRTAQARPDVALGIGDDAALVTPDAGMQIAISTDTLVNGVHFPADFPAYDVGYRALAVNLSDLAAMAAEPRWALLALTLPAADESWLQGFATGFLELAREYQVALIGGDMTQGPMSVTVTILGQVPAGRAIKRSGAQPGDRIFVTGTLGDAYLGLKAHEANQVSAEAIWLRGRFARPRPRVQAGLALRGLANSMIDVSDGLLADLQHILDESGVGARLDAARLPLSDAARAYADRDAALAAAATGGDDYELLFTAGADRDADIRARAADVGCPVAAVGDITEARDLVVLDGGLPLPYPRLGYRHF